MAVCPVPFPEKKTTASVSLVKVKKIKQDM